MDPCSFSFVHDIDTLKCPSRSTIPYRHITGSVNSGKADEECVPLGENEGILELSLLGLIFGGGGGGTF